MLIRCPRCHHRAETSPLITGAKVGKSPGARRMVRRRLHCAHCGLTRELSYRYRIDSPVSGEPIPADPHFREPLWLQAPCAGNVVWAYNLAHLEALESHIRNAVAHATGASGRRELLRRTNVPDWMVTNAHEVLGALAVLRERALAT
ncbi:MAG: hypothetical protein N2037_08770 [Acidimicrobiales bacterium]|nr:hypothetical protein [Acidimicrobiales bacterium]